MATEKTHDNPRMDTNWSGGKAYSWSCNGQYYSAADWTASVSFKRKERPLRVGDKVMLDGSLIYGSMRGKIIALHSDWAWVAWEGAAYNVYPETCTVAHLVRAED